MTMKFCQLALKILRLAMIRVGAGWMFALLTLNFNRIAIHELGALGIFVTTLIGLHHFISPFQVVWGRISDRYPLFGYRRGPYILLSAMVASLVFVLLPSVAVLLGQRGLPVFLAALLLMALFGMGIAAYGAASNALVVDTTTERERGIVVAVIWTFVILSGIVSAQVAKIIMPIYDPLQMQFLYNLTPFIVVGFILAGLIGMEQRITPTEQSALRVQSLAGVSHNKPNTLQVTWDLFQRNRQVRSFFVFILLSIFGIFLQDAILEVFGAEVFGLTPRDTAEFQQFWGAGVLVGMLLIGTLSTRLSIAKKTLATVGGFSISLSLALVAVASSMYHAALLNPALLLMGLGTGVFNVGALSMMMEMTIDGHIGLFMGIWGMAQGLGTGLANVLSGALHTLLITTELLSPAMAYTFIFGIEALIMILAIGVLRSLVYRSFRD